jgi:hypothetical protein
MYFKYLAKITDNSCLIILCEKIYYFIRSKLYFNLNQVISLDQVFDKI